jgi:protein-tyrosine phosphatase
MSGRGVDLHNHVIPGVDDGARTAGEAASALDALAAAGVGIVVATPHFDGSLTLRAERNAARLEELDAGWSRLETVLGRVALEVKRGAEVKLDVPDVDFSDPRLRLGGGLAALVEFPFLNVPPRSAQVLAAIREAGYVPVLAHPERYGGVDRDLNVVRGWLEAGAVLQVNAGSLVGRFGPEPQERAAALLVRGWVSCLASDYHGRGTPALADARALLDDWRAGEAAALLLEENPARLLRDEPCLSVPPVHPTGALSRLLQRLRPW